MNNQDMADFQDSGEAARQRLGIDGTAGDAQDVRHPYTPAGLACCAACGLSSSARIHSTVEG